MINTVENIFMCNMFTKLMNMKKKICHRILILVIIMVGACNLNLKKKCKMSYLSLANVEALASGESGGDKKCKQSSKYVNDRQMCSTNPVRYETKIGTNYSLEKDINGTLTSGKSGFEGTITSECASNPNDRVKKYTASTVNC